MFPDDLFREFERMFADLRLPVNSHARRGSFNPNADVYQVDAGRTVVVRVELAGVDRDNIKLVVHGRSLYLAGVRDSDVRHAASVAQKEIEYGYFVKRISLPGDVDVDGARAHYRDGMLTITLPVAGRRRTSVPDRVEIRMTVRSR